MWKKIENILSCFKTSFSRTAAYRWFVTIIIGIMVRTDKLGLTSVIRDLMLNPKAYESMMHFFRASSWSLTQIRFCWYATVKKHANLFRICDRTVLIGDGVKQSKEGHYMPGVKRLAQESETQTKPEMIHGHMWGCVGVLTGTEGAFACTPLSLRIHDGLQAAKDWKHSDISVELSSDSHVVQMVRNGCEAAQFFGNSYYLMDRYFLTVPALKELSVQNERNEFRVDIITKAKSSAVAYDLPPQRKAGQRGRTPKKGKKIKLALLFRNKKKFKKAKVMMYDKLQTVRFLQIDLLWGQGLYQKLRFVLVIYGKTKSILACTDTTLDALEIIKAYSRRFRIEHSFRELKQQIGGMAYHFWTKAMKRLNHFRKTTDPDPLESVSSERDRERILATVRATEMYALMSCIAMGILHIIAEEKNIISKLRYQRTPAKERPSEANVMYYLRQHFFVFTKKYAESEILQLIQDLQMPSDDDTSEKIA